jgi:predicted DsbA family dithiol-disulfide isomerase
MPLQIDVISDVVCPWCFIGKRKLARALELYGKRNPDAGRPQVAWHPYQLNPDLPEAGVDRREYLARKFGGRSAEIYARISAVGAEVGIPFAFGKVPRQPNTLAAHTLIALAGDAGLQDVLVEALFRAYFIDGRDLSANETLSAVACEAGLAREQVDACMTSAQMRERVKAEDAQARRIGMEGVPFFLFNRRRAVSGAQDPEVLVDAMLESGLEAPSADDDSAYPLSPPSPVAH